MSSLLKKMKTESRILPSLLLVAVAFGTVLEGRWMIYWSWCGETKQIHSIIEKGKRKSPVCRRNLTDLRNIAIGIFSKPFHCKSCTPGVLWHQRPVALYNAFLIFLKKNAVTSIVKSTSQKKKTLIFHFKKKIHLYNLATLGKSCSAPFDSLARSFYWTLCTGKKPARTKYTCTCVLKSFLFVCCVIP